MYSVKSVHCNTTNVPESRFFPIFPDFSRFFPISRDRAISYDVKSTDFSRFFPISGKIGKNREKSGKIGTMIARYVYVEQRVPQMARYVEKSGIFGWKMAFFRPSDFAKSFFGPQWASKEKFFFEKKIAKNFFQKKNFEKKIRKKNILKKFF